jgi:hypothetical protein
VDQENFIETERWRESSKLFMKEFMPCSMTWELMMKFKMDLGLNIHLRYHSMRTEMSTVTLHSNHLLFNAPFKGLQMSEPLEICVLRQLRKPFKTWGANDGYRIFKLNTKEIIKVRDNLA